MHLLLFYAIKIYLLTYNVPVIALIDTFSD